MNVLFSRMKNHTRVFTAFILLLAATSSSADKTEAVSTMNEMFCPDLRPQRLLELEQIMDEWYVVEVIKHKIDPINPTPSGHVVLKTCPVVTLRFSSPNSIRLLWTEKAGNLDYSFIIHNVMESPGFWDARGLQNVALEAVGQEIHEENISPPPPQNVIVRFDLTSDAALSGDSTVSDVFIAQDPSTLLDRKYVQFIGTVQVMKAVASHMVLTFCSKTPDNQLYSILLSRTRTLPESDSTGVRSLLSIRGLTIASVQETCSSSGSRKESSNVTRWIMILVAAVTISLLSTTAASTSTSFRF